MTSWFDLTNLYRLWVKIGENEDGRSQISKGGIQVSGTKRPWLVTWSHLSHHQFFFAKLFFFFSKEHNKNNKCSRNILESQKHLGWKKPFPIWEGCLTQFSFQSRVSFDTSFETGFSGSCAVKCHVSARMEVPQLLWTLLDTQLVQVIETFNASFSVKQEPICWRHRNAIF